MSTALTIALIDHRSSSNALALSIGLRDAGHRPILLMPRAPPSADLEVRVVRSLLGALTRVRKIGDELEYLPGTAHRLACERFDVAHAFTATDALAALAWSRRTRRACVFSSTEALRRETLAARRLRLATLTRAVGQSDAVVVPDERVADSFRRWLAVEADVVAPADGAGHVAVYERLSHAAHSSSGQV